VVKTEFPQLSVTVITGVEGTVNGAAVPEPEGLPQPFTVCVAVYVPALETVIDDVDAPVDQSKFVPLVESTEFPQLFVTLTTGAFGIAIGAAGPEPAALVHPPLVWVTV